MNDSPEKLLAARIGDMYDRAERDYSCVYSSFLDEAQCALAEKLCQSRSRETAGSGTDILYKLWGGYENAQRKMLCVYSSFCADSFMQEYPLKCLTFAYRSEDKLNHRDFLGSFMGMRLKRETIGDILVSEGKTQTFVTDTAARLIISDISKIGRVGVKVSDDMPFELTNTQKFRDMSGTVASLRLDCIVSLAAKISREKAAALIRSDKVEVNHLAASSVSCELKEGDILSVRGFGRYILSGITGSTKKGRIHINLRKYI